MSKRKEHIEVEPTVNESCGIEYSVHRILPRMIPDLERVFPGVDLTNTLVVPTFQECKCDLIANGPEPDAEKDRLLETFVAWAKVVCAALRADGHWAVGVSNTPSSPHVGRVWHRLLGCANQ
eukprot:m.122586 g.122586  ORF g.122586 m.122586 type:complete len:122 (-) comp13425_c0_seq2:388-753(-)